MTKRLRLFALPLLIAATMLAQTESVCPLPIAPRSRHRRTLRNTAE
jgi:hypothetical protein